MRFFLFILFVTFLPAFQCFDYKPKHIFVTRRDTKEAICIDPYAWAQTLFPTFDLDKLQIPRDVGFMHWDWLSEWQLQNYTNVRRTGDTNSFIAGNQPFHFVTQHYYGEEFYILASNISLWMARKKQPLGAGMLFELDHLNETTKLKDSTLKYCNQNPEVEGATCTIVDYKNGTNFLNDGNHWTRFRIQIKANLTGVKMFERSYGKKKPVVQCIWNNANISNPFPPAYKDFEVFAKSHQRNAAFFSFSSFYPDLANNKEMKRNYTKRSSGELCVWVEWNKDFSNDSSSSELMQVKNLVSGLVQSATNTSHTYSKTRFRWNHLAAGEYEFTLRCVKRQQLNIDLCQESGSSVWRTWTSIPKAITNCQFHVGRDTEFSAGPSSPPDPRIKPKWTLGEWAYVCDRLGIASNDTEVQIKFCDWNGCNFSKCPHLHDDPPHIFDF